VPSLGKPDFLFLLIGGFGSAPPDLMLLTTHLGLEN